MPVRGKPSWDFNISRVINLSYENFKHDRAVIFFSNENLLGVTKTILGLSRL